jgi:hypothetical protein
VISIGKFVSIWFLVSVPVSLFLGRFIRAGRGGERSAAMEQVQKQGVYVAFYCGPLGRQMVQLAIGREFRQMTLVEFNDLVHDALSVMVKRIEARGLIR